MKKNNKSEKFLITAGAVFIAAAVILAFYNIVTESIAGRKSDDILSSVSENIKPQSGRTPDYILNNGVEMPVNSLEGVDVAAVIDIPSLDLELPVIASYTKSNLKIAPCIYSGSAYTDDMVIAGHNYRTHFRNIGNLKNGDSVIITDMDGNRFEYTVSAVDILTPFDVEEMTSGEWALTLFTCNMSRSHRITVRCDKKQ